MALIAKMIYTFQSAKVALLKRAVAAGAQVWTCECKEGMFVRAEPSNTACTGEVGKLVSALGIY